MKQVEKEKRVYSSIEELTQELITKLNSAHY